MRVSPIYLGVNRNNYTYFNKKQETTFSARTMLFSDIEQLIKEGKIDEVSQINNLNLVNDKQETLLHSAARYNQFEITKYLLDKDFNPNQKNKHGKSPFVLACSRGNKRIIEEYLKHKNLDVNSVDDLEQTALHKVVDKPVITSMLLEKGASPYIEDCIGNSPYAMVYNFPKTLEAYLEHGVNPNTNVDKYTTHLHRAIGENNLEIAEILKKYDVGVNYKDKNGRTAIYNASTLPTLKWIVDNGAEINLQDKKGTTPLHQNINNGNFENSKYLLQKGADVNAIDKKKLPPLAYARTAKLIGLLLDNKANPDVVLPTGSTLLHNTVKANNLNIVALFVTAGADCNIKDNKDYVPLDYAQNNNIRAFLLHGGADPNYRNYLINSLKKNDFEYFSMLLEAGANPNKTDKLGNSAMFYLSDSKQIDEILKYKPNTAIINTKGYTPIQHYALLGNKKMVTALTERGIQDSKTPNNKTVADCFELYEKYNSWYKKAAKNAKQVTFTGFDIRNPEDFVPDYNKKVLDQKIKLTTKKIDEIIASASDLDTGITMAYKELKKEEEKVLNAYRSIDVILKNYRIDVSEKLQALRKKNPKGSKIPLVGTFVQMFTSGHFLEKIKEYATALLNNHTYIKEKYLDKNIKNLSDEYLKINNYLKDGVEYVSYRAGETKTRQTILKKQENKEKNFEKYQEVYNKKVARSQNKYKELFDSVVEHQDEKQTKRTIKKLIKTALTLGFGG